MAINFFIVIHSDGRLHVGDELLMVDGKSLVGLSHDEAVNILKATQKLVQLVVATEHLAEGASLNSSLQSIPEKMNFVRSVAIAPDVPVSPEKNAFQQDLEMRSMMDEVKPSSSESAETNLDATVTVVTLTRSQGQPLGLKIRQGYSKSQRKSIFVQEIDPSGVAGKCQQLQVGDELLAVNGAPLMECTQQEAVALITVRYYLFNKNSF